MTEQSRPPKADPDELADELEREADDMERRSRELEVDVSHARDDWERKRADDGVPGAPPRQESEERPDSEQ